MGLAHAAGRRAVKLVRKGQFEEAKLWHLRAATILQDLDHNLKDPGTNLCHKSLVDQVQFHKRQASLTQVLRDFWSNSSYHEQQQHCSPNSKGGGRGFRVGSSIGGASDRDKAGLLIPRMMSTTKTNMYSTSHPEILRQIDEADSLLQILCHRKLAVHNADVGDGDGPSALKQHEFTIKPKSDAEVIEELQIVNLNLRSLVDKLLNDLNESQQENARLRKRLSEYEPEGRYEAEATHNTGKFPHISSSSAIAMSPPQSSLYLTLTTEQESRKNEENSITATTTVPDYDDIPEFDPLDDPEFDMGEFQSAK